MALTVPDSVPSKASSGEKGLFKILRDELPDDCYVWYEPNVKGLYPDFIILGPTLGLLILEVKGWSASQILRASDQHFEIEQPDGQIELQQSPLRQAKGYQDALMNKLKGYSILCQDDGDYQGKLAFPIGVGAIMTSNYSSRHPGVRLITVKSALGLEFKAVIVLWVQQFGVGDEAESRRELYVSMTRAQDVLHLFGSGRFPVSAGIRRQ